MDNEQDEQTYWFQNQKPSKAVFLMAIVFIPFVALGLSGKALYHNVDMGLTKIRFTRRHGRPMTPLEELVITYQKRGL